MKKSLKFLRRWTEISLVLRIFVGLVIGVLLGLATPQWSGIAILGQVFVCALKAVAPVLVAVLVAASIAKANGQLGGRFRRVIACYLLSTVLAAFCAVVGSFLFPVTLQLTDVVADEAAPMSLSDVFTRLLTNMVDNPLQSVATGNYIGILFWAVLIGLALKQKASQTTIGVVGNLADVVSLTVKWIIQFAPFGILGLVFAAVAQNGIEIFTTYGHLILLLVGCMLTTTLIINPLMAYAMLAKTLKRKDRRVLSPYRLLFICLKVSGLQAFFTRSSAANIPINMALCKRLGLDEEFYSVSIPLGATINMNGAAVTITVMALAVAHTMGIQVSFVAAVALCIIATLGACGTSGVAGGSLLLIPMACSFFGISADVAMQAVAVGFIIGVVQDSVETALNSSADAYFTAVAEYCDQRG